MSYALSRPARAPDGSYYEVAASPRGDLLRFTSETGPQTWFSAMPGVLGFATFFLNRIVFRGVWRVIVRPVQESRLASPWAGVLFHRDVRRRLVDATVERFAGAIESGELRPEEGDNPTV